MKRFNILIIIICIGLFGSIASADIYAWTDESGVRHFTNYAPPQQARVLMKTEELPYDPAADKDRMDAERLKRLELAKLELAEKEARLARQQREAEQKIAEADRKAEEVLQRASDLAEQAKRVGYNNDRRSVSHGYSPYYKFSRYYGSHFLHGGNIYFKRHRINEGPHGYRFGHHNKHPDSRHHVKKRHNPLNRHKLKRRHHGFQGGNHFNRRFNRRHSGGYHFVIERF